MTYPAPGTHDDSSSERHNRRRRSKARRAQAVTPPQGDGGRVSDDKPAEGRWEQLNKCPDCGKEMQRAVAVGERIGLFYRCTEHGRFRYSWDHDRLERD